MSQYSWNVMFNYIMGIKHRYLEQYPQAVDTLFRTMCQQLNEEEFILNTIISEINHPTGHLVLVKYNILNCTDIYYQHSMYRECRSLVVNLTKEEIVLCPFKKFFNINELEETSLNVIHEQLKSAQLVEFSNKLDGSMQQFRWYRDHLVCSGSSALDVNKSSQLKAGLKLFDDRYLKMVQDHSDFTFIFECILAEDPHVVTYSSDSLNLIGIRNVYTGKILSYADIINMANTYNIPTTVIENTSLDSLISDKEKFKATEKEGWVIHIVDYNGDDFLYKLKCDDYVKLHKLIDSLSSHNVIIQAICNGTYDDMIAQVAPNIRPRIEATADKVRKFIHIKSTLIYNYYNAAQHIKDDKEFALAIQQIPKIFRGYVFALRKHRQTNLLRSDSGKYIKMNEIDNFLKQFGNADV